MPNHPEPKTNRAGGRVTTVVEVSSAFQAAIRAEARAAASEHLRTEATLAESEAAFEHIRARVRAAARDLIGTEPPAVRVVTSDRHSTVNGSF